VEVANPDWMSGGITVLAGLVLPFNRIAILLFGSFVLLLVWALLSRTRLGLWVRAVTQNRQRAAGLGVATPRIDLLAFSFGSGIACLGACALSLTGTVRPELARRLLSLGANFTWPQWPLPGAGLRTLFPRWTWTIVLGGYALLAIVVPVLHLAVPASSAWHVGDYAVTLGGKILCYATVALAMDLVWGYAGILSLGHGLFFALGGYAMGMYLMRAIGSEGVYGDPILPDFMVFLDWKQLPWYWQGSEHFLQQALLVVVAPSL